MSQEQKESSVLFSLKELMSLEEDRIRSEEAERSAAAAAAEKARAEAERSARDAEEARIRAEEERRRMEEARSREENARLEAIRVAEIEKARVDAEQRARLAAMEAQQHHERSLAAISQDESKKKLRNLLTYGAIAVVVLGGVGIYVGVDALNKSKREADALAAQKAAVEQEQANLKAQMAEQEKKVGSLKDLLNSATNEADKLKLQKQIDEEQAKAAKLKAGGGGPRPAGDKPAKPCNCTPGDPLCSCL